MPRPPFPSIELCVTVLPVPFLIQMPVLVWPLSRIRFGGDSTSPIRLLLPLSTRIPVSPFRGRACRAGSVPIALPTIEFELELETWIPRPPFAEITFICAADPPIVLLLAPKISMPSPPFASAAVPVAVVPM